MRGGDGSRPPVPYEVRDFKNRCKINIFSLKSAEHNVKKTKTGESRSLEVCWTYTGDAKDIYNLSCDFFIFTLIPPPFA